uniref:Lipase_GDSL domain-containing protein n=1 Tax=Caenorhabditis tropicalis TaxID=1561998 RepID=A0A1I7TTG2_9PELO
MGLPHFNCSRYSLEEPSSVHQLHPSQIDVVAALGDSVSVAQAAESSSITDILEQYPGVSFVTGGDVELNEQATLYNMFHQFSPRIKGGSSDRIQKFYDFNLAVAGSFSHELPAQAEKLSRTLKRKLGKENLKTWKFLNIFIGHNDLCNICNNMTLYGPETFGESIKKSLSIIESSIPNVFVNIMPPINVQIHTQAHGASPFCELSHRKTCSCIFELDKWEYQKIKKQFDDQLKKVVNEFNEKSRNSNRITVVIAPAMDLKSIPLLGNQSNVGLLALDCFHLSTIAHDIAAKQIWRGLFEPVTAKTVTDQLSVGFDRFVCPPAECPFLRTDRNSENCEPPKELRFLPFVPGNTSVTLGMPPFLIPGFFIIATAVILLFVRASFRPPSSEFSDERRYLLLPIRADLNDNIF